MRKLIVFLVFMSLLLLGGGRYLSANTLQNFHHYSLEKKHHIKLITQDQGNSIIEEAELDLDEENFSEPTKEAVFYKLFAKSPGLLDHWYLAFSRQTVVKSYKSFEFFGSSCGQSYPIYITQQDLRI